MKIWLKILLAAVIGVILGIFMPQFDLTAISNIFHYNSAFKFISDLLVNALLFLIKIYILTKIFLSIIALKKEKIAGKIFIYFGIFSIVSLIISIIIPMLLMNLEAFHPGIDFAQVKDKVLKYTTIDDLLLRILNDNLFQSLVDPTKFLLPVIFIAFVFGLATYHTGKKANYFVETVESFNHILDKIILQFLEIFSFGVIFIIVSLIRDDIFDFEKINFIMSPLIAVILTCVILILLYTIILLIVIKKRAFDFYLGYMGALFIALLTGNTAASMIGVVEHLKKNVGVRKDIADTLGPIGLIINKSGTVIISTIILLSLIHIYTPDILSVSLQVTFFFLIFFYSFFQDGSNANGFLVIVAMILNFESLHLEQDSYLLFIATLPIFSRIAVFLDALSTGVFIVLTAKINGGLEERKYIDYI